MVDVLLVNPREEKGFFEKMPPLGLAYIAANLTRHGHRVAICDFEVEDKGIEYWLRYYQPRFLGISGTTHTRFESFKLAADAKRFNKEIVTIYGGVHATFTGIETLNNIREIDIVVRGEGENVLPELIERLKAGKDIKGVRGISYRDRDRIGENPPAPRIEPLDSLPMPSYDLLRMDRYALDMEFIHKRAISLITSRGCLAQCSFCSASAMFNHRLTNHSAGRILDEISFLFGSYGFEGVKIFDSTLTMKRDHIINLCDEIIRRGRIFPWECEIRVGTVDRQILERMRDAGCYYVNFGIESASPRILKLMRKGITVERAEELLRMCRDVGIKTKVFFSFGHIGETMEDVEKTFRFIDRHQNQMDTVASGAGVRIYPGTYLESYALSHNLLPNGFRWSRPYYDKRLEDILQAPSVPVLSQPGLGFEELEKIALRIYKRRFSGWQGLKRGINKLTDPDRLRKLTRLIKLRLRHRVKTRR